MNFLIGLLLLISPNYSSLNSVESVQEQEKLRTGWYFVSETNTGRDMILKGSNEHYFIDPSPITTVMDIDSVEIKKSNYAGDILYMKLNFDGSVKWSNATRRAKGQRLAFVFDGELYQVPVVNAQINSGMTALNRGDITKKQLKKIKMKIEAEKKIAGKHP